MLLTHDLNGAHAVTALPAVAVYGRLAPVPAPVRGTTVPSAVLEPTTAEGTTNVHSTDMGAAVLIERLWDGSVAGIAGRFQPSLGLKKRHGATRGKPPREHLRGLYQAPSDLSRPRIPQPGSRPFFMASDQVAKPTASRERRRDRLRSN
jgi:hypothetical protein